MPVSNVLYPAELNSSFKRLVPCRTQFALHLLKNLKYGMTLMTTHIESSQLRQLAELGWPRARLSQLWYFHEARRREFALSASFVSELECFGGREVTGKGNDSIVL